MKLLRLSAMSVGCFALIALSSAVVAEDKAVDRDKIVGTWQLIKSGGRRPSEKIVFQFTKDGKLKITRTYQGLAKTGKKVTQTHTDEATYRIEGNKLTVAFKVKGKEQKGTGTIQSLTDKKLVTIDEEGREDEFEKK